MKENPASTTPTYRTFILSQAWHASVIGFFIGMLMVAIFIWMAYGFINLMLNLYHSYPGGWSHGAETMIKDVVSILASIELIRVFQSYLLIGGVKGTYILDVALVVLIGELISLWYAEYGMREVMLSIFVISALIALRIITTKYSPDHTDA